MIKKSRQSTVADRDSIVTPFDHHVKPAMKEWDRVVDKMPQD